MQILMFFYFLIVLIGIGLLAYVLIQRINQKDDFEDRDN